MKKWPSRLGLDWRTWLSAALIVLSTPPYHLSWLIWVSLVPWFAALERCQTRRQAFAQSFWMAFAMSLGTFYWVASVLAEFGHLPWIVAIVGLLLFALIGQPQFYLFGPVQWSWLRKPALGPALLLALLYAGLDWVLPKLFADTLGHVLYRANWLRQAADLGGPPLLTFVIVLANLAIWHLLRALWLERGHRPASLRPQAILAGAAGVAFIGLLAYGWQRSSQVDAWMEKPLGVVQVAMIQGNIGDFEKLASERGVRGAAHRVLSTMFGLSEQAVQLEPRPKILVWPETAYPSTFRTPESPDERMRDQMVEAFVQKHQVSLLFGGYDTQGGKDFNSLFFLGPDLSLSTYHKNILLLFGEYIPGMDGGPLSFLKEQFPQIGNFGRGPGPQALVAKTQLPELPEIRLGPVICYEALFTSFTAQARRAGAQAILNITNDSWFGATAEPWLHLALSTFRSVETRLPQLRSTNTGFTALIGPDGGIRRQSTLFVPEIVNVPLPIYPPLETLVIRWGDWFGPFALIAGVLGLGASAWVSRQRMSRP